MSAVTKTVKRWLINGIAIMIPLGVTLIVLLVVLEFVLNLLTPVVDAVAYVWADEPSSAMIQLMTIGSLLVTVLLIGFAAEHTPGQHASRLMDRTIQTIPGVSTIYMTVRRTSDILLDDDADQFREVKLIKFPHQDAFVLGFLTADTPEKILDTTGCNEMLTVMVPLGPNPTTNGFIMHMPADQVYDIDYTVEEAVHSIATLGVATDTIDEAA